MGRESKLRQYESDYLRRIDSLPVDQNQKLQTKIESVKNSPLNNWDYAVLECIFREDFYGTIKLGTIQFTESTLKLYHNGMIRKLDRELTFDERERLQRWLDSPMFKSYSSNLSKVMTEDAKEFIEEVLSLTGCKVMSGWKKLKASVNMSADDFDDSFELTEKGHTVLRKERKKMTRLYSEMKKQYATDPELFYDKQSEYEIYVPMMLVMGMHGFLLSSLAGAAAYDSGFSDGMMQAGFDGEFPELDIGF